MRIAFYISSLSGGGAEKVLITLANRFADDGNEIHVISLEKRPQFYELNEKVQLHKINNTRKNTIVELISDFRHVKKCFSSINANVSISFLSRCNIIVLLTNLFNKEKIIVCDRNNPLKEHSNFIFKISNLIYLRANKLIVQTNQIKRFYNKRLLSRIEVVENPINNKELYNQIKGKDIHKENTIISIGRLEAQKDFETLIKAFSKIRINYPDWKVKIFGIGERLGALQKLADSLGVSKQVVFCGRTQYPFYELIKSKIFVLSTNYEGFPNVLCEAMEAGLLCISSDCISGPNELIEMGVNGFLFPVGDVDKLSELIAMCIENNYPDMGQLAKKSVKRLHLDENIKQWKRIVENI